MNTTDQMPSSEWSVHYEVPPCRGIVIAYFFADSEQDIRDALKTEQPMWKIFKVARHIPPGPQRSAARP